MILGNAIWVGLGGDGPPGRELLRVPWLGSARSLHRLRRAAGLRPLRGDTGRTPFLASQGLKFKSENVESNNGVTMTSLAL